MRLNATEVDVSQFRLERVTLYSLNFHFGFFTVDNQSYCFAVEFWFDFHVLNRIMVQFDGNWSFFATVNDSWEFVGNTQAAARTLTLVFTYFYINSEHCFFSKKKIYPATGDPVASSIYPSSSRPQLEIRRI
ncbi:hypothetical protein SPRA44_500020 [Serratia proteamaculans]|nr:hypothetical protein SPRA44_500020 [Serratia proteamaculans]